MLTIDARMIKQSGIGTYLTNLLPQIIEATDNDITLLGNIEELSQYPWVNKLNVNIIEINSPIYSINEQVVLMKKIPKETKLYWSPHYNIPLLYKGKLLVTVHDVFHLAMKEYVGGIHKRLYAQLMFKALRLKATEIISVSEFTKSQFIQFTGPTKKSITTIHNGVDTNWFNSLLSEQRKTSPYLLYVGNIKPHKNLGNLLKAFSKIMNEIPHNLVIVGRREGFITGDHMIAEQADEIGNRVVFTGYINDEKLKEFFKNATALIFPSKYEGFGLPPLEAMASGCPVVVSNKASIPEICGEAAIYFNPLNPDEIAEKILLVVRNNQLRSHLIQAGLEQSKKFNWITSGEKTIGIINSLLRD